MSPSILMINFKMWMFNELIQIQLCNLFVHVYPSTLIKSVYITFFTIIRNELKNVVILLCEVVVTTVRFKQKSKLLNNFSENYPILSLIQSRIIRSWVDSFVLCKMITLYVTSAAYDNSPYISHQWHNSSASDSYTGGTRFEFRPRTA
jgi:hypothetical protein